MCSVTRSFAFSRHLISCHSRTMIVLWADDHLCSQHLYNMYNTHGMCCKRARARHTLFECLPIYMNLKIARYFSFEIEIKPEIHRQRKRARAKERHHLLSIVRHYGHCLPLSSVLFFSPFLCSLSHSFLLCDVMYMNARAHPFRTYIFINLCLTLRL